MNFLIYCIKSSFNFTPFSSVMSDAKMEQAWYAGCKVASVAVPQFYQPAAVTGATSHKSLDRLHSVPHLQPLALASERKDEVVNSSD